MYRLSIMRTIDRNEDEIENIALYLEQRGENVIVYSVRKGDRVKGVGIPRIEAVFTPNGKKILSNHEHYAHFKLEF